MFVDTMNCNELFEEYNADRGELKELTSDFDESNYVRKFFEKRIKVPAIVVSKLFTTTRNNRYVGAIVYNNVGSKKQNEWQYTAFHFGLMTTNKGECAIAFFHKSKQTLIFTPHFFNRYKERMMNICDWKTRNEFTMAKSIVELIKIYMRRNPNMIWMETKSVFYNKVHIFSPVNDGVALVQWNKDKKLLQANTFVTFDMLDEKQLEMVKHAAAFNSLPKNLQNEFDLPDFMLER